MPYTAEQIGPVEVSAFGGRTKSRLALVLIQHGRAPGHDETHVVVIAPCSWHAGRRRVLEMVAWGVDISDIRFARVPSDFVGAGEDAGEGLPLEHVSAALWWTTEDDYRRGQRDMTAQQYAQRLVDRRNAHATR